MRDLDYAHWLAAPHSLIAQEFGLRPKLVHEVVSIVKNHCYGGPVSDVVNIVMELREELALAVSHGLPLPTFMSISKSLDGVIAVAEVTPSTTTLSLKRRFYYE